jgi:hypothetical protein
VRRLLLTGAAVAAIAVSALTLDGIAYAATGSTLVLGRLNTASTTTVIQGGSAPVLSLRSSSSASVPLAVNGTGRVANLNADRLDSLDASQLQRRISTACTSGQAMVGADALGRPWCRGIEPAATLITIDERGPFDEERTFTTPEGPSGRFLATFTAHLTPSLHGTTAAPKQASCLVGNGAEPALTATGVDDGSASGAMIRASDVVSLNGDAVTITCGFTRGTWSFGGETAPRLLLTPLPAVASLTAS